jgi:hypothetical protein
MPRTRVPVPGALVMSSVPPAAPARSRMFVSPPEWAALAGWKPEPSSLTSKTRSAPISRTRMVAWAVLPAPGAGCHVEHPRRPGDAGHVEHRLGCLSQPGFECRGPAVPGLGCGLPLVGRCALVSDRVEWRGAHVNLRTGVSNRGAKHRTATFAEVSDRSSCARGGTTFTPLSGWRAQSQAHRVESQSGRALPPNRRPRAGCRGDSHPPSP